jgi:hypothetical protein
MIILKKIWAFLKTHWYIPVILLLAVLFRGKIKNLTKILEASEDRYKKQLNAIETAEKEKTSAKVFINKTYKDAVSAIEKEYKTEDKKLNNTEKKYIREVVKNWKDDPEQIAERFAIKFGLRYVPKNEDNTD